MATFSVEEQRILIRFLHFRGDTPAKIHRQLKETCGDCALDMENVLSWVRLCVEGRVPRDDDKPKQRRPQPRRTMRTPRMIAMVEEVIMADRRVRLRDIADKVGTSVGTVYNIVHEDLRMESDNSQWVPSGEPRDPQLEKILKEERRQLSESRLQWKAVPNPRKKRRKSDNISSARPNVSGEDSKSSGTSCDGSSSGKDQDAGEEQADSQTGIPSQQHSPARPHSSEEDSESSASLEIFEEGLNIKEESVDEVLGSQVGVPNEEPSSILPDRVQDVRTQDDNLPGSSLTVKEEPSSMRIKVEASDEPEKMQDVTSSVLPVKQEAVEEESAGRHTGVALVKSFPNLHDSIHVAMTYGSSEAEAIGIDPEDLEELPRNQVGFKDVKDEKMCVLCSEDDIRLLQAKRKSPEDPDNEVPSESQLRVQGISDVPLKGSAKKIKAR